MQQKSQLDKNTYDLFSLENGLKTLMVLNPLSDKSACALAVRTGSYDDNIPGIAHFLEHMLFMGTKEYPTENDFMDFLSKHNGSSNAFTANDITLYYFDIDPKYFVNTLKRFSSFFKTPLFLEDSIDRELNAVDSEYKNALNYESQRIARISEICFNDAYSKFSYGNNETLRIKDIRDKVIQFWRDKYSANKMCLTLYHNEDVELEVTELFSEIETKNISDKLRINTYNDFKPQVIRSDLLGKIVKIVPRDDIKEIKIHIELPIERDSYKTNVYGYISFLLQNESKNYITNILKIKGFIFDLFTNFWNTYTFTICEVTFKLTDKGYAKYIEVLNIFYNYIKNINLDEEEYIRISKSNEWKFRFLENQQPSEYVITLAEDMFVYPQENLLNHEFLYERFDERLIYSVCNIISNSENWLIFLISKEIENENIPFLTEKYFDVKYSISHKYIPKNDSLIEQKYEYGNLCFVYEKTFEAPKSYVIITLNTKIDPKHFAIFVYYLQLVDQDFTAKYDSFMYLNSVSVEFNIIATGIQLNFNGNNKYIGKCIEKYFECFKSINPVYFDLIKHLIKTENINQKNKPPYKRVFEHFHNLIAKNRPSIEELIEIDNRITFEDIKIDFNFYIDFLVFGSCNICEIQEIFDALYTEFGCAKRYTFEKTDLPDLVEFETEDGINNAVCVFVDVCNRKDYDKIASLELIVQNSSEVFFDKLRTNEALGYIVKNEIIYLYDRVYFTFIVQSEKSSQFLKTRILEFIEEYKENILKISEHEFLALKNGVTSYFSENFKNLGEMVDFNLELYISDNFNLSYKDNIKEAICRIEQKSLGIDGRIINIAANKKSII